MICSAEQRVQTKKKQTKDLEFKKEGFQYRNSEKEALRMTDVLLFFGDHMLILKTIIVLRLMQWFD